MTNNFINICDEEPPDCANPPHANRCTALLDCAAFVTCLGRDAVTAREKYKNKTSSWEPRGKTRG